MGYYVDAMVLLRRHRRLAIYIVSGVTALVSDYLFFLLCYYLLRFPVEVAAPVGLTVGLLTSFFLNKLWTFSDRAAKGARHTVRQGILYGILFALNNLFTVLFINNLSAIGVSVAISKVMATAIITFWNYFLYKKVIFK